MSKLSDVEETLSAKRTETQPSKLRTHARAPRHPEQIEKQLRDKAAEAPVIPSPGYTLICWENKVNGEKREIQVKGEYKEAVAERDARMSTGLYFKSWLIWNKGA